MSKKSFSGIIGIIVGLALLYFSVRNVDFETTRNSFAEANFQFAVAIFIFLAIFYWLKAMRWRDILSPVAHFSAVSLFPSMASGAACNNLLPAHLGEIVRIYLLGREIDVPKSTILASLIVERIFDLIAVLLLLTVALSMIELGSQFNTAAISLAGIASIGLTVTFLTALYPNAAARVVERSLRFLPPQIVERLCLLVAHLSTGLLALRDPRLFTLILGNSIVQWLAMAACVYFSVLAFDIWLPPYAAFLIVGILVAGLSLPTSPGFIGTIQFCFVLGLKQFGIEPNTAFAISIFYHTIIFVTVTSTGLYFLHHYQLKLRSVNSIEMDNIRDHS